MEIYYQVRINLKRKWEITLSEYGVLKLVDTLSGIKADGWCYMAQGNMAKELDMSRRHVIRCLKVLESKGLVEFKPDTEMPKLYNTKHVKVTLKYKRESIDLDKDKDNIEEDNNTENKSEQNVTTPVTKRSNPCDKTTHNSNTYSNKEKKELNRTEHKENPSDFLFASPLDKMLYEKFLEVLCVSHTNKSVHNYTRMFVNTSIETDMVDIYIQRIVAYIQYKKLTGEKLTRKEKNLAITIKDDDWVAILQRYESNLLTQAFKQSEPQVLKPIEGDAENQAYHARLQGKRVTA